MRERQVKVFYDRFFEAETWGKDLFEYFDEVYRTKARFAVVFVSTAYVDKAWTTHERRSAQARSLIDDGFLLPVRLDQSELPGLRPTTGYAEARTPSELVELIVAKLSGAEVAQQHVSGIPRTAAEQARLLRSKPPAWEHLLFGGVLRSETEGLDSKWRDFRLGLLPASGIALHDDAATIAFVNSAIDDIKAIVGNLNLILNEHSTTAAFGAPGESGDEATIIHLAKRLVGFFADLLAWSERVRSVRVQDHWERCMTLLAAMGERPTTDTKSYLDKCVATLDEIPQRLASGRRLEIELVLTLVIADGVAEALGKELRRIRRRRRR